MKFDSVAKAHPQKGKALEHVLGRRLYQMLLKGLAGQSIPMA